MGFPTLVNVLRLLAALLIASLPASASWHSVLQVNVGTSYVGPGDINGSASTYWGFQCISNAYTGNVADVWDGATGSTTETLIKCVSGTLSETINALSVTCSSSCKVKTLYDQSGANLCSSAACDATQATNANRPVLTLNLVGTRYGMTCNGAFLAIPALSPSGVAQPVTHVWAARRTSGTSQQNVFGNTTGGGPEIAFGSANTVFAYVGSGGGASAPATDNVFHAVQMLINTSVSSAAYVDGTNTVLAALTGTSGLANTAFGLCGRTDGSAPLTGNILVFGTWPANKSANNSAVNSLIHAFWGF